MTTARLFDPTNSYLRPFIERKQQSAWHFASAFAPKTWMGIWVRNQMTKLLAVPPVAHFLVGRDMEDRFDLPNYEKCRWCLTKYSPMSVCFGSWLSRLWYGWEAALVIVQFLLRPVVVLSRPKAARGPFPRQRPGTSIIRSSRGFVGNLPPPSSGCDSGPTLFPVEPIAPPLAESGAPDLRRHGRRPGLKIRSSKQARNDDVARPASPSTTTLLALGVTARRRRHRRMFPGEPEGATDSAGNAVIPARNGSVDEMGTSHRHGRAPQCDRRKLPKSPAAVKNAMHVLPLRGPQACAPSTRGGR